MSYYAGNLVELESFLPDIEPELPRCPVPVMENRIRDAIIDACERANIWRWKHPEIAVIAGQQEYDLFSPTADLLIHSIVDLRLDGKSLNSAFDDASTHEGHYHRGYAVVTRGRIRLTVVPNRSSSPLTDTVRPYKGLEPFVTVKPSRTTLEVSEVLRRDYYQLIVAGTLAKAMRMLNRPWTDVDMAKRYEQEYEFALAKARQGIDRGFRTGSQRVYPRRFA